MKRIITLLLVIAICLSTLSMSYAVSVKPFSGTFVCSELSENTVLKDELFGTSGGNTTCLSNSATASLDVSIAESKDSVYISLELDGTTYVSNLTGKYDAVNVEGTVGFVGIYDGYLNPTVECNSSTDSIRVTADTIFSENEIFVALSIYGDKPEVLFFGDYSDTISSISNANTEQRLYEANINDQLDNASTDVQPRVNATVVYQGGQDIYQNSYKVGALSVFHADELVNQNSMTTYAKVNTNTDGVESYLVNELGYNSNTIVSVYPDTFNVSLCGNNSYFHAVSGTYTPENSSTSATILVPYYLPKIGFNTTSYNLVMSSTTISVSPYTSSSSKYPNNRVSWEIYRRYGWNSSEFDGDYSTDNGISVSASYQFEGNPSSTFYTSVTGTATIRYEYYVMVGSDSLTLHFTTTTATYVTSLSILP